MIFFIANPHEIISQRGMKILLVFASACPVGKPSGLEAFRGYGFAGGAGSNSKKIFSDEKE